MAPLLRCSVCFFLVRPLDLEDDTEIIVKGGYSLCEEHSGVVDQQGHSRAIAEANRAATSESESGSGD